MVASISFACPHCSLKIKVKEEHAGKSTKCPACKKPITVPLPSATVPWTPPRLDGQESSLAKAGVQGGVTLEHDPAGRQAATAQQPRSVAEVLTNRKQGKERYVLEGEIARGGMGAVVRAIDADLRREVAIKFMLDDKDPKKKQRFIEEAQITGQLEHPNIVPVHELGVDAKGRPFFAMKMIRGQTLAQVLDELRQHPRAAEKDWTLGRLLNVWSTSATAWPMPTRAMRSTAT